MSLTSTYAVTDMTCAHCVTAVTNELTKLAGVRDVTVSLVTGGAASVHVTSDGQLDMAQVRAAVDEAGYDLASETP